MKPAALHAIAIATICIATPHPSVAQNSAAATVPITILACDVIDQHAERSAPDDLMASIATDKMVRISFTNQSPITIRDVTFRIDARGGDRTISDLGRFSSGVSVQQTFGPFGDVRSKTRCGVASVTFEDGTVWLPR